MQATVRNSRIPSIPQGPFDTITALPPANGMALVSIDRRPSMART